MKINLKDRLTTSNRSLIQYDYGQKLEIYNTGLSVPNLEFQFIQNGEEIDQLGEYDVVNDCYNVNFPDKFLLNDSEVNCFVYLSDGESGKTIKVINFQIFDREMFDSIPDEETEDLIGQLIAKVNELQEAVESFNLSDEQLEYIASKIDLSGYVKDEEFNSLRNQVNSNSSAISALNAKVDDANAILEVI